MKTLWILSSLVALSACSTVYPVAGVVERSGERFVGKATSTSVGTSTFEMTSDRGVKCKGTYIAPIVFSYTTGASIQGTGNCADGRKVTWAATGTAVGGQGFGTVGNNRFRFYFGQFAANQQIF